MGSDRSQVYELPFQLKNSVDLLAVEAVAPAVRYLMRTHGILGVPVIVGDPREHVVVDRAIMHCAYHYELNAPVEGRGRQAGWYANLVALAQHEAQRRVSCAQLKLSEGFDPVYAHVSEEHQSLCVAAVHAAQQCVPRGGRVTLDAEQLQYQIKLFGICGMLTPLYAEYLTQESLQSGAGRRRSYLDAMLSEIRRTAHISPAV